MAHSVCPAERARMLDNPLRSLLIRPNRLLAPYVKPGMTVLDIGCGPGFFITHLAQLSGPSGRVIAADLQIEMLDMVAEKINRQGLSDRVILHQTLADSINLPDKNYVDFVIAFHMVHEVPCPGILFSEVFDVLKKGGIFLLSEPKGHVKKEEFDQELIHAKNAGFTCFSDKSGLMEYQIILKKS